MALPKILDLETEVLAHILEFIDDESSRSTAAIAQVCKHFNFTIKLIQYRRLIVHWDQDRRSWVNLRGQPQQEWETPELLRGLRHLTVCRGDLPLVIGDDSENHDEDENDSDADEEDEDPPLSDTIDIVPIGQLESVLRNAANLKSVLWKVGYLPPHGIIAALQAHQPKAKLNIFRAMRLTDVVGLLPAEKALAASPCLNTFSMTASNGTCIEDHMTFQVIVALAPNLSFASLVSHPPMRPSDPELSSRFRARPELWFPNNQENRKPNTSIRHLTLDGWSLSAETLEYWSRYVDLASLESFKGSRGSIYSSYFQRASQLLTNLKHVSLNLNPQERNEETAAAIEQYIVACPPLLSLSLWSWRGGVSLPGILNRHGSTLNALHLHEREESWTTLRDTLSLEEIRSIRESCPQLRDFTFDLNRASRELGVEDHVDTMEELRKFNLDQVQIYLDCGVPWLAYPAPGNLNGPLNEVVVGLPGYCDGDYEYADAVTAFAHNSSTGDPATPENSIPHFPPSTNKEICRFLIRAWKDVFGSHTTGSRQMDLKFGEWERKHIPFLRGLQGQRDVRVWCRARPHERDDMQGECVVEIECCGSEHKRKFISN